jgi:hypothetical protein
MVGTIPEAESIVEEDGEGHQQIVIAVGSWRLDDGNRNWWLDLRIVEVDSGIRAIGDSGKAIYRTLAAPRMTE